MSERADEQTALVEALREIGEFAMSHSGRDGHDVLLRALYRIGEECERRVAVLEREEQSRG